MATSYRPAMDRTGLIPATDADIADAIGFALGYDSRGKPTRAYQDLAIKAAAMHLLEQLQRRGFVIMRRPPEPLGPAHPYDIPGRTS